MPRRGRRIGRIALNALTGLSLLLCVAALGFVVRGNIAFDSLLFQPRRTDGNPRRLEIASDRGALAVMLLGTEANPPWHAAPVFYLCASPNDVSGRTFSADSSRSEFAGIRVVKGEVHGVTLGPLTTFACPASALFVPMEWLVLLSAILPASALLKLLLRRAARRSEELRVAAGLCPRCGYDLTGNVSGTCPECGRPVVAAAAAAGDAASAAPPGGGGRGPAA